MKYFNSIAESAFKNNPNGEGWLFYTNGILSKGRVVTDIDTKEKLFKFQKKIYIYGLSSFCLLGLICDFSKMSHFFILALLFLGLLLLQYLKIRNLPISNHKLKFKEAAAVGLQGLPNWYHKLLYIFSATSIVLGLSLPIIFSKPYSEVMPLTLISLGIGILAFVTAVMVQKLRA